MYDLVIINYGLEGRYIALKAVKKKYRVALVEQPFKSKISYFDKVFTETLSHFAKIKNNWDNDGIMGFNSTNKFLLNPEYNQILDYGKEIISSEENQYSLVRLAELGVDVIQEKGDFCKLPKLGFITENRQLYSHHYLITTGGYYSLPLLTNFKDFPYLTLSSLFEGNKLNSLDSKIVIFAEDVMGIELAYSLASFDKEIVLVSPYKNILPHEDGNISHYIQAQLEAKGINIILQSNITQIKNIEQQTWIQVGDQAIETNEIIYCGKLTPNMEGLNLEGVGVNYNNQGIIVNKKLQTSHPNIYACGSVIGGYNNFKISQYEGEFILKNIKSNLFSNPKINYHSLSYQILSYPNVVRLGLTEKQASDYTENIVIKEYYNFDLSNFQFINQMVDYCKVILTKNQEILGVHIIGDNAENLINIFALAMEQKIDILPKEF
jgi:pyruvate/2-oxoglutarate dehydrogenase complex dihydrolipoamide dehydrogenase (E3) component